MSHPDPIQADQVPMPMSLAQLSREIRVSLNREFLGSHAPDRTPEWKGNSWGYLPASLEIAPQLTIRLTLEGRIDPILGYVCDIRDMDRFVRCRLQEWYATEAPPLEWYSWILAFHGRVVRSADLLPPGTTLHAIEIVPNPYVSLALEADSPGMIQLTREYEFSAAHRLHVPQLTPEENRERFGKCNRPHGHGHNYVLAVTVELLARVDPKGLGPDAVSDLDMSVRERVLSRLDHLHLNLDVEEFATTNPTVENIAKLIWRWLDGALRVGELLRIRLHETPKTWVEVVRPVVRPGERGA